MEHDACLEVSHAGLFIIGGVIGELVAAYGWITGTVWYNS